MSNRMLNRRHLLQAAVATVAVGAVPGLAFANSDALLADILVGVGDALRRDYIREHYRRGRWDGHYWIYEGRRYSPLQYRDFWLSRYQPPPPPPPRPAPPPPPPHYHAAPPPPHPPGKAKGHHKGPGGPGRW